MAYNILILGAAYGSLLASKMLFGGHKIHHICLPAEADLINAEGFRVRLPVKGRKDPVILDSTKLPGKVTAGPAVTLPGSFVESSTTGSLRPFTGKRTRKPSALIRSASAGRQM